MSRPDKILYTVLGLIVILFINGIRVNGQSVIVRRTPTAAEWKQAYEACRAEGGTPVVLASPDPARSLGIGCVDQRDGWD